MHSRPKHVLLDSKPLSVIVLAIAFVALVLPFDSFRGPREQTRGPFLSGLEAIPEFAVWDPGSREAMQFNFEVLQ